MLLSFIVNHNPVITKLAWTQTLSYVWRQVEKVRTETHLGAGNQIHCGFMAAETGVNNPSNTEILPFCPINSRSGLGSALASKEVLC